MRGTLSNFCTREDLQKKFSSVDGVYGVVFRWKALSVKNIISAFTFRNSIKSCLYIEDFLYVFCGRHGNTLLQPGESLGFTETDEMFLHREKLLSLSLVLGKTDQ